MLLHILQVEVAGLEIGKYFEPDNNKNITYQTIWEAAQIVPRPEFVSLSIERSKQE